MKILGIDPALNLLGWGIIEIRSPKIHYVASGVIKTDSKEAVHKRLSYITDRIREIIEHHKPDLIAMEETFVNINAVSSLKLSYARGAIMALIGKYDLPYFEYKPNMVKKTVTGAGHAEKYQLAHMIKLILSGVPTLGKFDEADALAVAYTCSVLGNSVFRK